MASTSASRALRSMSRSSLPRCHCRCYATAVPTPSPASSTSSSSSSSSSTSNIPNASAYAVFDRQAKIKQKNRAVKRDLEHSRMTDYVKDEVAANLVDRLMVRLISCTLWKAELRVCANRTSRNAILLLWTLGRVLVISSSIWIRKSRRSSLCAILQVSNPLLN